MPRLGVAIICQNEEQHIPASIAQFYFVAEEIVVVDGGSVDSSPAWAQKMGAEVKHRPFDYDFAAQKNYAIEQLNTDWVYVHDPDERVEPTLLEIMPMLISADGQRDLARAGVLPGSPEPFDCYGIPRRNYIDGIWVEPYPDYQYRLFRRYCRYEKPVHEEIKGFTRRTEVDFKRNSMENPSRFNILHYKSSERQAKQNALYERLAAGLPPSE